MKRGAYNVKRPSIKDVAREAGVSTATVSYVLNNRPGETISAETTARVQQAVVKLQYVPNLNARSLPSRRTNLIGVVIPQTEPGKEFMFSNPFYGELLSAVEYTARKSGYHLLLSGMETDQSYLHIARNRGVDGIIIVGTYPSSNLDELRQTGIPVVLVDTYIQDSSFHTIGIHDREGGRMAVRYLLGKGHRRIAFISGSIQENGVNEKRYRGYREALEEAGVPFDPRWVYSGNVDYAYGVEAAEEMARRGGTETAAFVTADVLGMGLVKGLHRMGRVLPRDLSIVSFDDVYLAQMAEPSLTTVHQDITLKGESAVRMILRDTTEGVRERQELILPIRIVERGSVKDLNDPNSPRAKD